MNPTLRTLSPALISACLTFPLFADPQTTDAAPGAREKARDRAVGAEYHARSVGEDANNSTKAPLGEVVRASQLMGIEVRNLQDEKLGKVTDLAVEVASGRIVEIIVSTGGVLGVGSSFVAVPPSAFHYDEAAKVLHLDSTPQALKDAPAFDNVQWNAHFQATNVVEVYRHYGVAPYFNPDGVAADNTGLNKRDRSGDTLTPLDQGTSPGDVALTKQIRKEVLARDGLSMAAKNVKIITLNGRVTLRGPVNSEAEKRAIGDVAERAAQPGNVDNQLEVKREVSRN